MVVAAAPLDDVLSIAGFEWNRICLTMAVSLQDLLVSTVHFNFSIATVGVTTVTNC